MAKTSTFPMLDGPPLTRLVAKAIYDEMYVPLFKAQEFEIIEARGGFSYAEIKTFAEMLARQDVASPKAAEKTEG